MKAVFEATTGIIRVGEQLTKFGDAYEVAAFVCFIGDTAHISGAAGKFSTKHARAIVKLLKEMGYAHIIWKRSRDGEMTDRNVKIKERE